MKLIPLPEQRDDVVLVDRLYTIEQAAQMLALGSTDWLYSQIRDGNLPYVDLGVGTKRQKLRLRASTINKLIDQLSTEGKAA